MLFAVLGDRQRSLAEIDSFYEEIWAAPAVRAEVREVLSVLADRSRRLVHPLDGFPDVPLQVHGTYALYEIIAALGLQGRDGRLRETREGVLWCDAARTDLLFVTLRKSERDYSPSTLYQDHPISRDLFHWESQSGTRAASPTGLRYQRHAAQGSHVWLFTRERRRDDRGFAVPYVFLGPVTYAGHRGERPMAVTWRLHRPMPAEVYLEGKVAEG